MSMDKVSCTDMDIPIGTIDQIETIFDEVCRKAGKEPPALVLNLSTCDFIEVTSLVWIISLLSSREEVGLKTEIRMPRSKSVRDFMRVWGFAEAVRDAVGIPFEKFLVGDDYHIYLSEVAQPLNKTQYAGRIIEMDGVMQRLLAEGFFAFTSFVPRKEAMSSRIADKENAKWREDRILSVLNRHLDKPGNTVSSHIVHEAMMNALRHPEARIIQTVSRFHRLDNFRLKDTDLTNWREFVSTLARQHLDSHLTPGQRLWAYFPSDLAQAIEKNSKSDALLRKDWGPAVVDAINCAIQDSKFYSEEHFQCVPVSSEIAELAKHANSLAPKEVYRLNRAILEASFSDCIRVVTRGHLTIVFRDDGEGSLSTLKKAIDMDKNIRSVNATELPTELIVEYVVVFEDENGNKSEEQLFSSDLTPNKNSSEEMMLFTTLLPGITRDISGGGQVVDEQVIKHRKILGKPGMGLYVLTSEAIDVYGGSVSFRTGRYFLNVQAFSNKHRATKTRYSVKVKRYGTWCPPFKGNMVTIRLPLK